MLWAILLFISVSFELCISLDVGYRLAYLVGSFTVPLR